MRDEKKRSKKRVAWMAPQQKRDAFPKRKAHKHAKCGGKKLVGLLAPGVENAEMKWTRESRAARRERRQSGFAVALVLRRVEAAARRVPDGARGGRARRGRPAAPLRGRRRRRALDGL